MGKWLLLIFCIFHLIHSSAFSQIETPLKSWAEIEQSIKEKRNFDSIITKLIQLRDGAKRSGNEISLARTYYYLMLINDWKKEDTFYFKNSAFIDSLLSLNPGPKLKLTLNLMQSKRLAFFKSKSLRFNKSKYEIRGLPNDYASYSNFKLDSIILVHFESARIIALDLNKESIEDYLWLVSDPLLFLYKPVVYDIVAWERINYFDDYQKHHFRSHNDLKEILSLSQDEFINQTSLLTLNTQPANKIIDWYSDWMQFNKSRPEAYYYIETLLRKWISRSQSGALVDSLYENYLTKISGSDVGTVKVHGVYQLCLWWNKQANKYFPGERYTYFGEEELFKSRYQYLGVRALELFEQNQQLLDSFAYLKSILISMKDKLLDKQIKMEMDRDILSAHQILTTVTYKNTQHLYCRIIKTGYGLSLGGDNREIIRNLLKTPGYKEHQVNLTLPEDHNLHRSHIKLEGLETGKYYLLFSDNSSFDTTGIVKFVQFEVSGIAVLNSDNRIYVLDRRTGMPIENAKVVGSYFKEKKDGDLGRLVEKTFRTGREGFVDLADPKIEDIEVFYKEDSVFETIESLESNYENDEIYNEEDYDDLVEYYADNLKVQIFTDRSIYRPGQTVYYKALFMTRNPSRGEWIVLNKKNLKGSLFKNWYKRLFKEEEPELTIIDPFDKIADSIPIRPNEFGSQSGSFKIPKTAATGEWFIETGYDHVENEGLFRVEEYKRPSYEIKIENPGKKLLYPGDSIQYKVKLRSFAGAALNNVRIEYTLNRTGYLMQFDSMQLKETSQYRTNEVLRSIGYTNGDGELVIVFVDSLLKTQEQDRENENDYNYEIEVKAIDESGETYRAEDYFSVSSRPIRINIPFAKAYDIGKPASIKVQALDQAKNSLSRTIRLKIWKTQSSGIKKQVPKADQRIYPVEELERTFPFHSFRPDTEDDQLVLETLINTGTDGKFNLPFDKLSPGKYSVEGASIENGKITGERQIEFSVYDLKENIVPDSSENFYDLPINSINPGDSLKFIYGSSSGNYYTITQLKYYTGENKVSTKSVFYHEFNQRGINTWSRTIASNAIDHLIISQVYILNNQLFKHEERVFLNTPPKFSPEIIVERYKKTTTPGGAETFSVSIKTNNENTAAELLTTMYDATLDKLNEHEWNLPRPKYLDRLESNWPGIITGHTMSYDDEPSFYKADSIAQPLWWINPLDYSFADFNDYLNPLDAGNVSYGYALMGRASGVTVTSAAGLDEVVVIGYGTSLKRNLSGSIAFVQIRGSLSPTLSNAPLVVIDGVVYDGDVSKLDPNTITEMMILKGADATALYGSRAAQGVILLSTKGPVIIPGNKEEPLAPKIRKNFSETAFFFPNVYADKDGYYKFTFTMPESVTEWNWKLFAHNKKAEFAYAERKITTQLPLMVQPHMPRLMYMGDRIVLQSRITNLDSLEARGKIRFKAEDIATGEDITSSVAAIKEKEFIVGKKSNTIVGFEVRIPAKQLNPVRILISASAGNFADAEEHVLPILSPKIFVRSSKAFRFTNRDTIIQAPQLPNDAELYGIGLSINPKPQAALINSLPYLANFPYSCAEQIFNKIYAHTIAVKIMRTDEGARQSFERAKNTKQDSVSRFLPDQLQDQTMPWLGLGNKAIQLQSQLMDLFDTLKTKSIISQLLEKIYKLQNPDGGIAWFEGGKSNEYISSYILAGFGKMNAGQLLIPSNQVQHGKFIEALYLYCYSSLLAQSYEKNYSLYNIYAIGYWTNDHKIPDPILNPLRNWIGEELKQSHRRTLYEQALLLIASFRYSEKGSDNYKKTVAQLNSLRQLANFDEDYGLRWKDIADADDMSSSSEETMALLAEAFELGEKGMDVNAGIVKWLLNARNEDRWSTTKGTAAAINTIQKEKKTIVGPSQSLISKSFSNLNVTDDNLRGKSFGFHTTTERIDKIPIEKFANASAAGTVSWYYFSMDPSINSENGIGLEKKLYVFNSEKNSWTEVIGNTVLKPGDKVRTDLTINTAKALRFVFIDDKRAAAFEPAKIESGYNYSGGISYYQSVRDAGMQIFAEFVPSGRSIISYEWVVSQEGEFQNGPASLQCMYKPEANAYSNGMIIRSVK